MATVPQVSKQISAHMDTQEVFAHQVCRGWTLTAERNSYCISAIRQLELLHETFITAYIVWLFVTGSEKRGHFAQILNFGFKTLLTW